MADEKEPRLRILEDAERYIYISTSVVLIVAAAGLLLGAVIEMVVELVEEDYVSALLHLLDRALLVLMLAEIIFTVRRISQRKRLEAEPFFIVAIIAAIRRMLVITAESTTKANLEDPTFVAAMVELGLLAAIILALAVALRLIPKVDT